MSVDRRRRIDFFVSYTSSDTGWAEWIAWQLKEAGFQVRLQKWHFEPGSDFMSEMNEAVTKAHRTIAVLSPAYLKSAYCRAEWQSIFTTDVDGRGRRLVPVCIEKCSQKELGLLRSRVYIDLTKCDGDESARQTLLNGLNGGEPDTEPTFPGASPSPSSDSGSDTDTFPNDTVLRVPKRYPGVLPAVWTVPSLRNPDFTGREALLESVASSLRSGEAAAVTQAIAGLGGVGKTQLAIEYAYRHAAEYDAVLWVGADGADQATSNLARQALEPRGLKLPGVTIETPQNEALRAVRNWLEDTPGWLLIFDNANHPDEVRPLLPRSLGLESAGGHVLITSRHQDWAGTAQSVGVPVWSRAESLQFVQERTRQQDAASAEALCEALGDLPLAVAQACGYITATGITVSEYLELFQTRRADLWDREQNTTSPPDGYHSTVATTWSLAVEQLSAPAVGLLRVCACLAPEPIPGRLFQTPANELGGPVPDELHPVLDDPLAYRDACAELRRYSLVEISEEQLRVHRLLQAGVHAGLHDAETWATAAVTLVDSAFQSDVQKLDTWALQQALLPHVIRLSEHPHSARAANAVGPLLIDAAVYEISQGQFASARALSQQAIVILSKAYDPEHPVHATSCATLAACEQALGNLLFARELMQIAIAIDEKAHEPDHPTLANRYSNLGTIERDLGDLLSARELMQRAINIEEKAFEPDDPKLAVRYSNLAAIEQELGDQESARELMRRSIDIWQKAYESDHPTLASGYSNLAMIELALGDIPSARELMQRAIAINEKLLERDHPTLAIHYSNLGGVEHDDGKIDEARRLFERAHEIFLARLGPKHPHTQLTSEFLSNLAKQNGWVASILIKLKSWLSKNRGAS